MRFAHISDLHIGKKLKEMSLEEDQRYILGQIVDIVREEHLDGVLIAGDVYDTTTPTIESVRMLDDFLTALVETGASVFMISGNHDSPEKLGFGSRMFERNRLYISGVYSGHLDVHTITKDGQTVDVCLLPFIKPVNARRAHPEDAIESYADAVASAISHSELVPGRRRILVTHQFVVSGGSSPETSDSETVFVGGTESMDASLFDGFDYVALGHIHTPQSIGRETIRYCGTPLVYSKSEVDQVKSMTIVDVGDTIAMELRPLEPLRAVRVISGTLDRIIEEGKSDPSRDDFVYVDLESDAIDAMSRLREVYPNVLSLEIARGGSEDGGDIPDIETDESLDLVQAFADFYRAKNGEELTPGQMDIVKEMLEEVYE